MCESSQVASTDNPATRRPSRAFTPYWVSLFIAFTVLLSVVAADRIGERRRLTEKYSVQASSLVAKMATDFDRHLDQLAEDARLLAELLWQSQNDPRYPAAMRSKVLRDGVHALSSAVEYCRGVAFSRDGQLFETSLDPDEDPALAGWLEDHGRRAYHGERNGHRLLGPYLASGNRPFFVLAEKLPTGVVVAAIDTRQFFEILQHRRPPDARAVIVDADLTLWFGCGSVATCRMIPRDDWNRDPELSAFLSNRSDNERLPAAIHRMLALPHNAPMVVHWHSLDTGSAPFALGLMTSLSELQSLRQAGWWRLLSILAAMTLSAGIVIGFLWRQRQHERILRERLLHAEELNRLEHQLVRAEKLATVGVLAAGLAHELGTPLAIIRGRAEMLEEKTKWPEIKTILDQTDRIASTLRQVLDFSREQPVAVQPTDVVQAFRTVMSLIDFRLRAKNIDGRCEPAGGSFWVAADPDQLQQVLVNLVLNACDACQSGGKIILRAGADAAAPGFVRIEVIDNGCGIPAAQLDAVFDPFFTTKPKGEGTGLGLPVAAGIVRNHQGQISISSEGKGTTVTLLWPAKGSQ
jgi:signal transduction histidine kinase